MIDITAHVMIRNEEYWIGHVLQSLLATLDRVIIADTGSEDRTVDIVEAIIDGKKNAQLITFKALSPHDNGHVRQILTDMTKTEWAMIVDGDEWYPEQALRHMLSIPMPYGRNGMPGRMGFTTLQVIRHHDGKFWMAEKWSKHAMLHVPTTRWVGAYPFEHPTQWDDNAFFYYEKVEGLDFHHLKRSSMDDKTPHRHDGMRQIIRASGIIALPLSLGQWPNPYQEVQHAASDTA